MKPVSTQIATSMTADFDEKTWTFLMPDNYSVWAGSFAIMDKQVYDKVKELVKYLDGEELRINLPLTVKEQIDSLKEINW